MASNSNNNWYFTKEQLESTPSKQCGVEPYKELSYRQQAANFIQDMGQKLKVSQLCINTAIVYMHRFYVFHSFTRFPWNSIAAAAIFLAAKVEEQPRKLEHVIRVVNICKNPHDTNFDTTSERYLAQSQDLVFNENILLQTLGFDVAIDHPHTHVVRCCHLVRASKDLAQTSYFMASNRQWKELAHQLIKLCPEQSGNANTPFLHAYKIATKSLHLTTMCLQYKPTVVACFCIHFVCKWSNWEIPLSNEKKEWFSYVDETVTSELLEQLTKEFLFIYDRCPSRLKEKIMAIGDGLALTHSSNHPSSPFESDKKFGPLPMYEPKDSHGHRSHHGDIKTVNLERVSRPHEPGSSGQHRDREREYREKKDRERMNHHVKPPHLNTSSTKPASSLHVHHHTHGHPVDPKLHKHTRPPIVGANTRMEPRDILREAAKDIGLRDYKEGSNKELPNNRELNQQIRVTDKREYVQQRQEVKPSTTATVDSNSLTNINYNNSEKRVDASRSRPSIDPKLQTMRRREEVKPYNNKLERDIKKHLNTSMQDKNSFLHKSVNSNSHKINEIPKVTVSSQNSNQPPSSVIKTETKPEIQNSSSSNNTSNSSLNLPIIENDIKAKFEASVQEETVITPTVNPVKKPSLFSPEKSPPQKKLKTKTPPSSVKKTLETLSSTNVLPPATDFELPVNNTNSKRSRTSSTNSEPELRPVLKKIDQVQGFENIMRDSSIGIKLYQVPEIIAPITDAKQEKVNIQMSISKELKPPDLIPPFSTNASCSTPIVNGIETNPTIISSLLKEAPSVPHLHATPVGTSVASDVKKRDHHKEHKKNKKEKHKHKDKERSRDEKEKKKKHKDKDREKHKYKLSERNEAPAQPIKITIFKDKVVDNPQNSQPSMGVKLKIPKERLKTDGNNEPSVIGSSLKIKIPKEIISSHSSSDGSSKKRERDRSLTNLPPSKISKSNHNRLSDVKIATSKSSYNKVSNLNSNSNSNDTAVHNVQTTMFNNVNHMSHPMYGNQNASHNYFYNYPPPTMQIPMVPANMNVPPPHYMYQQYYPGYMYHSADMYSVSNTDVPPPLPQDPPPNNPPPPPPDS